jgi:hypothetical protein
MLPDRLRILLNLLLAPLQPLAGALAPVFGLGQAIGSMAEASRTPLVPAPYAFVIWTPIFALAIAYGVWQALPAQRNLILLRRIGWMSALAFACNITWMLAAQLAGDGWYLPIILGSGLLAALAGFLAVARDDAAQSLFTRILVRPLLGLLAGWLSAAFFVNVSVTAQARGFDWFGHGPVVAAMLLLLVAAGFAGAMLRLSRGDAWYAAAVLWALLGIIVANLGGAPAPAQVGALAGMCMVLVLLAVLRARRPASQV